MFKNFEYWFKGNLNQIFLEQRALSELISHKSRLENFDPGLWFELSGIAIYNRSVNVFPEKELVDLLAFSLRGKRLFLPALLTGFIYAQQAFFLGRDKEFDVIVDAMEQGSVANQVGARYFRIFKKLKENFDRPDSLITALTEILRTP